MLIILVLAVIFAPLGFVLFRSVQADNRIAEQANLEMHREFSDTLKAYRIKSHEIVSETVKPARDALHLCEVHRIIFDDRGQYYFYIYYSGHRGILKPISEERALLAARTKGQVKV